MAVWRSILRLLVGSQSQEAAQAIVDDILSALGTMRAAIEQPTTIAPLARPS
ncbi:hypothetical protein [Bradyrhizobium sp. USDA 4520]